MKMFLLLLFLMVSTAKSQDIMDYYPPDKYHPYLHSGGSAVMLVSSYYLYRHLHQKDIHQRVLRLLYPIYEKPQLTYIVSATLTSLIIGIIKEMVDAQKNNSFNMQDMQYNFMGIQGGILFIYFFEFDFEQYP